MYYPDLVRHSFFRSPAWRWLRARRLVDRGMYVVRRRDDEPTGRAGQYLRAVARCQPGRPTRGVPRRLADVHAARLLHEAGGATRLLVQARLLARQSTDEIARLTSVPAAAVDAYEALFFACRASLAAPDWVTA